MTPLHFLAPENGRGRAGNYPIFFIPGWAFDGRVLELIVEPPAWYSPAHPLDPATFSEELLAFLNKAVMARVVLIGWSMGAYLVLDFARRHPERVAALVLLAMRSRWPAREIEEKRAALAADADLTRRDFYRKCFLGYQKDYRHFQAQLLDDYLAGMPLAVLDAGLAYLAGVEKGASVCRNTICLHGGKDIIAPLAERGLLSGGEAKVLAREGHALFLGRGRAEIEHFLARLAGR